MQEMQQAMSNNQSYMPQAKSDIHLTPDRVYIEIFNEWGLHEEDFFDPCPVNPQWDGLKIDWQELNFVNPPYTLLKEFVAKAISESYQDKTTVMLLPAKTDQTWFHTLIHMKYAIKWIEKRLKFKNNRWSATQPHFLVLIKQ